MFAYLILFHIEEAFSESRPPERSISPSILRAPNPIAHTK